jgi:ubiquinone biosynthesis protein UbiJ
MHPHYLAKDMRDRLNSVVSQNKKIGQRLQELNKETIRVGSDECNAICEELNDQKSIISKLIGDVERTMRNAKALTSHIQKRDNKTSMYGLRGHIHGNAQIVISKLRQQHDTINRLIAKMGGLSGNSIGSRVISHVDDMGSEYQEFKTTFARVEQRDRHTELTPPKNPLADPAVILVAGLIIVIGSLEKAQQMMAKKLKY